MGKGFFFKGRSAPLPRSNGLQPNSDGLQADSHHEPSMVLKKSEKNRLILTEEGAEDIVIDNRVRPTMEGGSLHCGEEIETDHRYLNGPTL